MNYRYTAMIRNIAIVILTVVLNSCVVYSKSRSPNHIRSTNSSIIVSPEPTGGRDVSNVNGRIVVGAGMRVNDVDSVNGRVIVEDGATARNVETVNGRVVIEGSGASVEDVETVNGRITAVNGGQIRGNAKTVNGRINLANTSVGRTVKTSNGSISLFDVTVGENVETRNGDIRLENSIVERDLVVHERRSWGLFKGFDWWWEKQDVIVGPGSEIKGNLIAREEINLYVHQTATVNNIVGANALIYSGSRPPRH